MLFEQIGTRPRFLRVNLNLAYGLATMMEKVYGWLRLGGEPMLTRYTICTLGYSQTLDITRAVCDLGYTPRLSIEEGIKKYADDYRARYC